MATATTDTGVKFHCSLNVSNLNRSVKFYETLFGIPASKRRDDYAKFEPGEPALVLSLIPMPSSGSGTLNHVGLRLANSQALVEVQMRLEAAGIRTQREEGVECCYSRQTKFWVEDPDRTLWELYVVHHDIDHAGEGQTLEQMLPHRQANQELVVLDEPVVWEHRLMDAVPERVDRETGTVDEVRLQGSFNDKHDQVARTRLLSEAFRILKPGGTLNVHTLVADRQFPGEFPKLPGPASYVRVIPLEDDVLSAVQTRGFHRLEMAKFRSDPCFTHDGVQMRELLLTAVKPAEPNGRTVSLLYRGPFQQLTDDSGVTFMRGRRTEVPLVIAEALQSGPMRDAFVVMPTTEVTASCSA